MLKNESAIFNNNELTSFLKYVQNAKGMNITSYQSNLHAFYVFNFVTATGFEPATLRVEI